MGQPSDPGSDPAVSEAMIERGARALHRASDHEADGDPCGSCAFYAQEVLEAAAGGLVAELEAERDKREQERQEAERLVWTMGEQLGQERARAEQAEKEIERLKFHPEPTRLGDNALGAAERSAVPTATVSEEGKDEDA